MRGLRFGRTFWRYSARKIAQTQRRRRRPGLPPGAAVSARRLLRDGRNLDLDRGAVLLLHLDLDADGRQLDPVVREAGEPVRLGVVEDRLASLAADVGRLTVDVQGHGVGLLETERRVVHLDPGPPGETVEAVHRLRTRVDDHVQTLAGVDVGVVVHL